MNSVSCSKTKADIHIKNRYKVNPVLFLKAYFNNAESQFDLAWLYDKNNKHRKAYKWYVRSANNGYTEAKYNLAILYENGLGVSRNIDKAIYWYESAIKDGSIDAMFNLGIRCYKNGSNENINRAISLLSKAANLGHTKSQYNLGVFFEEGEHVIKNINESMKWFTMAAKSNYPDAMHALGNSYFDRSSEHDKNEKAFKWFEKAANLDLPESQYNLAWMLSNGIGVKKDLILASAWNTIAKRNGISFGTDVDDLLNYELTSKQKLEANNKVKALLKKITLKKSVRI